MAKSGFTIGATKIYLRKHAPHIARQYSALWSEFVTDYLTRFEKQHRERFSEGVFNDLHDYGMDEVKKHGLPGKSNPDVVTTIRDQLHALGVLGRGVRLVKWDANTLKVSRGTVGALIHYNRTHDLYDVQGYEGMFKGETVERVYAQDLGRVVKPLLQAKGTRQFNPRVRGCRRNPAKSGGNVTKSVRLRNFSGRVALTPGGTVSIVGTGHAAGVGRNPGDEKYEVIVGNIGSVYSGNSKKEALRKYQTYVAQSKSGAGRAGRESVTLMEHGEPVKEHFGQEEY